MEFLHSFLVLLFTPVPPILFGMAIASLIISIPCVKKWNQSSRQKILVSFIVAILATLIYQTLTAWGNMERTLSFNQVVNPLYSTVKGKVFSDVQRELLIRELLPRIEEHSCYLEHAKVCDIASQMEWAAEGWSFPEKESITNYTLAILVVFLSAWLGSIFYVMRLSKLQRVFSV